MKFNALNHDPSVNVGETAPLMIDRLGALAAEPPVVPNVYVLVVAASAVKPPVPVQVKLVAVAMFSTVVAETPLFNTMLPDPNAILRVVELLELNMGVVNVNPARSRVPLFNVVVPLVLSAAAKVVVPE